MAKYYTPSTGEVSAYDPRTAGDNSGGYDINNLKSLVGQEILKQPNLSVSEVTSGLNLMTPPAEDANVKKRKVIVNQAIPVLNQVFQYALTAPTGWEGWRNAMIGKLPGQDGGDAEQLDRTTDGFARLIASAFASEVGVATDRDVNRWKRLMPQPGDTYRERVERMNSLVTQVNSESKGLGLKSNLKAPKLSKEQQTLLNVSDKTSTPVPKKVSTLVNELPPKSMEGLNLVQRMLGTSADTYKPNLPLANAGGEIGSLAGPTMGKLTGLPPGIRTLLSGAVGQTYENVGRQGIPLTRQSAQNMGYSAPSSALGYLGGPIGGLITQPESRKMLAQTAPGALLDLLFSGHEVLGKLRGNEASKLSQAGVNIPGKDILSQYIPEASARSTASTANTVNKTIGAAEKLYGGGKNLEIPDLLKQRSMLGDISRTTGGTLKTTVGANLSDIERRTITNLVKSKSGTIAALDALDTLLYGVGGATRRTLGRVASAGVGALGFGLGSRLLGGGY